MRKSRRSIYKQDRLLEHFVAGTSARTAASFCGVNRQTAAFYFHRLPEVIAFELDHALGSISYFADPYSSSQQRDRSCRIGMRLRCSVQTPLGPDAPYVRPPASGDRWTLAATSRPLDQSEMIGGTVNPSKINQTVQCE
jgi:hypothetical protein